MPIRVRYFASLRETMGHNQDEIASCDRMTVADVWHAVAGKHSPPKNVLAAVNQEYASFEHRVGDGDEVAFFPPVTGG